MPNLIALFIANWECYKSRLLPEQLGDTARIAALMFILLEAFLVGGPVLVLVHSMPAANFGVRAVMIVVMCVAILVPLFLLCGEKVVVRDYIHWSGVARSA